MADSDVPDSAQAPDVEAFATSVVDQLFDVKRLARLEKAMRNAHAEGATVAHAAQVQAGPGLAEAFGKLWDEGKDAATTSGANALAWLVGEMLGVDVSAPDLQHSSRDPERSKLGEAIGAVAFKAVGGSAGALEPSDEPAKRFLGVLAHIIVHGWAEGILLEWIQDWVTLHGHIEEVAKLGKELVKGLGLSRMARTAFRPIVQAAIATPLEWKVNRELRPKLLPEALAVKQFLSGNWSNTQTLEELRRLGYSEDRIDALLREHQKYLSTDDLVLLAREGVYDRAFALGYLRAQGYDATTAQDLLAAQDTKRANSFRDDSLAALRTAFADRRLTQSELETHLQSVLVNQDDYTNWLTAAQTIQAVNTRRLSETAVKDCVKAGILAVGDYRRWLEAEGFDDDSSLALELLLRHDMDKNISIDKQRQQAAADRAAEKQARAAAAAAKKAEVEAHAALARRGSVAELSRAVVRGLIPIARLEEVLGAELDPDTVRIYVASVEHDRQAYLDAQQKAEEARQRAATRAIDVGALEQAVLENILSVTEFRTRLEQLHFAPADADLLTQTLAQRKADLDKAKQLRADAEARAKKKSIDLTRFELLVRKGHRSLMDYDAMLAALGYDDGSRAAMGELLQLQVADDQRAAAARLAAANQRDARGVSLAELRRAVVLGVKTPDDYQRFLVDQKFTADAQVVLMAELRDDVASAEDARQRRATARAKAGDVGLSIAALARAARLGLISPGVYQTRLRAAGYSDDDIAIELDLLTTEMADLQAQRAKRAALEEAATDKGLSLVQLEHAVKAGLQPIDAYRARAQALGYNADAVDTLVGLLQEELDALADAATRKAQIDAQLKPRNLSLGELEAAVKAGLRSLADYHAQILQFGFSADDADLLTSLLATKLPGFGG